MAIISATTYQSATNQTISGGAATALATWCSAVDSAIKRKIRPFYPEPTTVTDCILDAPADRDLYLPVTPVRSATSVYYRSDANGLAANFTSDYLLDNTDGAAYQLVIDDVVNGYAKRGLLRRVGQVWGLSRVRPPERLGYRLEPERGALKVTFAAGPSSLPDDIFAAAVLAVSMLFERKESGVAVGSESWNGYSRSIAGPFTAEGAVNSPDVLALLMPYMSIHVG